MNGSFNPRNPRWPMVGTMFGGQQSQFQMPPERPENEIPLSYDTPIPGAVKTLGPLASIASVLSPHAGLILGGVGLLGSLLGKSPFHGMGSKIDRTYGAASRRVGSQIGGRVDAAQTAQAQRMAGTGLTGTAFAEGQHRAVEAQGFEAISEANMGLEAERAQKHLELEAARRQYKHQFRSALGNLGGVGIAAWLRDRGN